MYMYIMMYNSCSELRVFLLQSPCNAIAAYSFAYQSLFALWLFGVEIVLVAHGKMLSLWRQFVALPGQQMNLNQRDAAIAKG